MSQMSNTASMAELRASLSLSRQADKGQSQKGSGFPPMPPKSAGRVPLATIRVPEKQISMGALRFFMRSIDILAVISILTLAIWNGYVGANNNSILAPIAAATAGSLFFITLLFLNRAHHFRPTDNYWAQMRIVAMAVSSAIGLWLTFALIIRPETFLPDTLAKAGITASMTLLLLHSLYYTRIRQLHNKGALIPTVVMLGATESARRVIEENAKTKELNILAIFDDRLSRAPNDIHGVPVIGKIEELLAWDKLPYINRVVVTLPSLAKARKDAFFEQVRKIPNRIAFVSDEFETLNHVQQRVSEIAEISLSDVAGKQVTGYSIAIKRMTDVILSSVALIFGAPFLLIIGLLIKMDSPGPVIFKQPRHGFNNKVFSVYKFRSMAQETEDLNAAKQVTANDTRVTKIGRFIRKTSIDELPQLINVLKGEMSLVGPRPHATGMKTAGKDSLELVEEYAHRHRVKPGMTGWAQINGSRGALETAEDVARRVQLDVDYIERQNFWLDLYIMIVTLPVLLGDRDTIR